LTHRTARPTYAFVGPQEVRILSATPGAVIHYTTDGTGPTESSPVYSAPIKLEHSLTLEAKAWHTDYFPSETNYAEYTLELPAPTFKPDGGTYGSSQNVTISCEVSGTTIRYTTDVSEPTESSTVYTSPISIDQSKVLKAKAWKDGWTTSETKSADYTIGKP
jgi:hypothetical protein